MGRKPKDITGQRFGSLVAIKMIRQWETELILTGECVYWLCKCECGTIYLTMRLKNKLPPTIRCEVYKDAISLKRSGIKIIPNEPVDKPIAKMIVCPKCKSKCISLFENKGMCWKCYKKNYNV